MAEPEDNEARRLLDVYGNGPEAMSKAMDRVSWQFNTIQGRSQLLLTLGTITLTITGFSGPTIAGSSLWACWGLGIGLGLVLASILLLLANLRIVWLSQFLTGEAVRDLASMIRYRDVKTRWYRIQIGLLGAGLTFYVGAIIAYFVQGV